LQLGSSRLHELGYQFKRSDIAKCRGLHCDGIIYGCLKQWPNFSLLLHAGSGLAVLAMSDCVVMNLND